MSAREFLESKIGHFNSTHPFLEKDVDYEDIERWLDEYADKQSIEFMKFNADIAYKGDDVWLDFVGGVEYTTSQLLTRFHELKQKEV